MFLAALSLDVRRQLVREPLSLSHRPHCPHYLTVSTLPWLPFSFMSSDILVSPFSSLSHLSLIFIYLLAPPPPSPSLPSFSLSLQDNCFDVMCFIKLKGLFDPRKGLDVMHWVMSWFANIILSPLVWPFIVLLFGITSTLTMVSMFDLKIGLDQTLALPKVKGHSYTFNRLIPTTRQ